jgi:hypothetical protein
MFVFMYKNLIKLSEFSIIRTTFVTNSDNPRSTVRHSGVPVWCNV